MDFAVGGLASGCAAVVSNPLDVLKTRMQLQGELKPQGEYSIHYRNVVHAAYVVAKHDGLTGLQKGLGPAILMHMLRSSLRLGLFEICHKNGMLTDQNENNILWRIAVCSALSGAFGAFVSSPFFLAKTQVQLQTKEEVAVGHQHGYHSATRALIDTYKKFGIRGLWRGANSNVVRALAGSSSQLTGYIVIKDALNQSETFQELPVLTSFIASIGTGAFQTIIITPFDIVSVRIYSQGVNKHGEGLFYKGMADCYLKMWQTEGILGFYKGVVANYMRLAPHAALTLVFWDILKEVQHELY